MRVVRIFPNPASCLRFQGAVCRDPRGLVRRPPLPVHGLPHGTAEGPAAGGSMNEHDHGLSHDAQLDVHKPVFWLWASWTPSTLTGRCPRKRVHSNSAFGSAVWGTGTGLGGYSSDGGARVPWARGSRESAAGIPIHRGRAQIDARLESDHVRVRTRDSDYELLVVNPPHVTSWSPAATAFRSSCQRFSMAAMLVNLRQVRRDRGRPSAATALPGPQNHNNACLRHRAHAPPSPRCRALSHASPKRTACGSARGSLTVVRPASRPRRGFGIVRVDASRFRRALRAAERRQVDAAQPHCRPEGGHRVE